MDIGLVEGIGLVVLLALAVAAVGTAIHAGRRGLWVWAAAILLFPPAAVVAYVTRNVDFTDAQARRRFLPVGIALLVAFVGMALWIAVSVSAALGAVLITVAVIFGLLAWIGPRLRGEY